MRLPSLVVIALTAAAPREAIAAPTRATPLGVVLELRSDFGFAQLAEIEYPNGRRITLHANDGLAVAAGASFLPLAGGRLVTRASVGVKLDRIHASNGNALFLAFPLDLAEGVYVGPLRLAAGVSILLAPRIDATGILDRERIAFGPAPGVVLDAEWILSSRARTGVGVRASWYRLASGGEVRGAPSVGLVIRADFPIRW